MSYCICYVKFVLLIIISLETKIAFADLASNENHFSAGVNSFTSAVYKELAKSHQGNFLVCPLSAEIILALVHSGAGGKTAEQLAHGLSLPNNKEQIQQGFQGIAPFLKSDDKNYTLSSANKIFVKDDYKIMDQFNSIAVSVFGAETQSINFEEAALAASKINKWVETKTQNKISNLVNENDFDNDTRAVLVNAMYFHGKWLKPFPKEITEKKAFHVDSKTEVQVDMMQQTNTFLYKEDAELNLKVLVLPYDKDNKISMWFILPNDVEGLSTVEANIKKSNDPLILSRIGLREERVAVEIPKFKIETKIDFNPVLKSLGIVDAFTPEANFERILFNQSLLISKVIQKTFIEVDEEGTEAAAATGVQMHQFSSLPVPILPPKEFIACHPFIYFIKIQDIFFFIGRYTSP